MKEGITFCEECREDVPFSVNEVSMTGKVKGESIEYQGRQAKCSRCGNLVYVNGLQDSNLKNVYDAYREKYGIISLELLRHIPEKYCIGKRPLSLLLGWGELTFTRYYDGYLPNKPYSDVLKKIYDEPAYYLDLLEKHKNRLPSQTAYEKSRRTVDTLLGEQWVRPSKIDSVVEYILFICEDITPLALQKGLYYVQGFYRAFMGEFLFGEDCEAWVHGPVYRDIYNRYSNYRYDPIEGNSDFDVSLLTDKEKAVVDSVVEYFCCYSGKVLEYFTHAEDPWLKTRGDLPADVPSYRVIQKDVIGDYFVAVKQKYNMLIPNDIKGYAQAMFEGNSKGIMTAH